MHAQDHAGGMGGEDLDETMMGFGEAFDERQAQAGARDSRRAWPLL